jgi:hypothetical protein
MIGVVTAAGTVAGGLAALLLPPAAQGPVEGFSPFARVQAPPSTSAASVVPATGRRKFITPLILA